MPSLPVVMPQADTASVADRSMVALPFDRDDRRARRVHVPLAAGGSAELGWGRTKDRRASLQAGSGAGPPRQIAPRDRPAASREQPRPPSHRESSAENSTCMLGVIWRDRTMATPALPAAPAASAAEVPASVTMRRSARRRELTVSVTALLSGDSKADQQTIRLRPRGDRSLRTGLYSASRKARRRQPPGNGPQEKRRSRPCRCRRECSRPRHNELRRRLPGISPRTHPQG